MPRFFKEYFADEPFIDGDDAAHIIKSLRMRKGEPLTVCDTAGTDYFCVISGIDGGRVSLEIVDKRPNATEPSVFVTLYQCLGKGDKMDTVVRQAVEIGVCRIVPVLSSNCVSRPDAKSAEKKAGRWQKIAFEAAGQSGRGILPEVGKVISIDEAAELIKSDDICFFCYELGGKPIGRIGENIKTVSFIIGPEGGFIAEEAELLVKSGAVATTLGPRILRTETAPIVAVTEIMLQSGNLA